MRTYDCRIQTYRSVFLPLLAILTFLTRMYKVDSAMYLKQFVLRTCLFSLKFCCRMTILTQRKTLDKKSAMLYYSIIHVLCCHSVLFIIRNCIHYNHIVICVMYYSLLNSSLPYVLCYMLYVIYMLHMWIWDQTREVCFVRRVVLEWEDFKVIWAMQFPLSLSLSTATYTAHRDATAKLQ